MAHDSPKVRTETARGIAKGRSITVEQRWQQLGELQPELARVALVASVELEKTDISSRDAFLRGIDFALACMVDQQASDEFAETMVLWLNVDSNVSLQPPLTDGVNEYTQ